MVEEQNILMSVKYDLCKHFNRSVAYRIMTIDFSILLNLHASNLIYLLTFITEMQH